MQGLRSRNAYRNDVQKLEDENKKLKESLDRLKGDVKRSDKSISDLKARLQEKNDEKVVSQVSNIRNNCI